MESHWHHSHSPSVARRSPSSLPSWGRNPAGTQATALPKWAQAMAALRDTASKEGSEVISRTSPYALQLTNWSAMISYDQLWSVWSQDRMRKYDAQTPSPPGDVRLHHPEEEAEVDQRELPELPRLRPQPFNWPAEATATSGKRGIEGHPELTTITTKTLHPKIYMEFHGNPWIIPGFHHGKLISPSGVQVISISR